MVSDVASRGARRPTRSQVARSASDYIARHADGPIDLRTLREWTGVSERTLRQAFRETYGLGPSRFVKRERLRRVRAALERSRAHRTSVLREAVKAGFWHMGRFSAEYRDFFGELPSVTLGKDCPPKADSLPGVSVNNRSPLSGQGILRRPA